MRTWTYGEGRAKVEKDLDMENETFIDADEMAGYWNEGIDEAEAEIHMLGLEDDYFLAFTSVPLVQNRAVYPMPTNIYANKIRAFRYENGTNSYPIKRVRRQDKFEKISALNYQPGSGDEYSYTIQNLDAGAGPQMVLVPPSQETAGLTFTVTIAVPGVFTQVAHGLSVYETVVFSTDGALPTGLTAGRPYYVKTVPTADTFTVSASQGGTAVTTTGTQSGTHSMESGPFRATLWFIRNATRVPLPSEDDQAASDATQLDIPEFINFVMQYVKCRIWEKEGSPNFQSGVAVLEQQRKMMVETLSQMVPDDDDKIQPDLSHYLEHN